MISIDAVRAAMLSDMPWTRLDEIVRAEMSAGRKVKEIFGDLNAMLDDVRDTSGLSEDGDDAILDTLDALTGNCRADQCYQDPPNTTLPSEEEVATLPRWARVAFAARCARRVTVILSSTVPATPPQYIEAATSELRWAEHEASSGGEEMPLQRHFNQAAHDAFVGDYDEQIRFVVKYGGQTQSAGRAAYAAALGVARATIINETAQLAVRAAELNSDITPFIRRDFDHLSRLAEWQKWGDDTPVPPEVFGPLWPEGPPKGWPPVTHVPQRAELVIEAFARERATEQMIEDDIVNLFNALNRYHIARSGVRLTLEQFRSLLPAFVLAEV